MPSRNVKGRVLHWSICHSRRVASLPGPWQKLLFSWIVPSVDNVGRMEADPFILKGMIFPRERFAGPKRIEQWRDQLHEARLLCVYEHNGDVFLQLIENRQRLTGKMRPDSDYPPPPKECPICGGPDRFVQVDTRIDAFVRREGKGREEKGGVGGADDPAICDICKKPFKGTYRAHVKRKHKAIAMERGYA